MIVGKEEKKTFTIHTAVITSTSHYFKTALKDSWNCPDGALTVEGIEPNLFGVYVHWLYSGDIDDNYDSVSLWPHQAWPTSSELIELFIFGDMVLDRTFCNRLLDQLLRYYSLSRLKPNADDMNAVWTKAPRGSPLRTLLLDYFVIGLDRARLKRWVKRRENLSNEFMLDLVEALLTDKREPIVRPTVHNVHKYHFTRDQIDGQPDSKPADQAQVDDEAEAPSAAVCCKKTKYESLAR